MTKTERAVARLSILLELCVASRYARAPIPCDEDVLIEELLGELDKEEAPELPRHMRSILGAYAIRSASHAVRENEPAYIQLALDALRPAAAGTRDWRDLVSEVCVLYDAARRLGIDPRFALANGGKKGSALKRAIDAMLALPASKMKVDKYGFIESSDADGFRYAPKGRLRPSP